MTPSTSPHFSYLLRLWLAGDDDQPEWRLALIDPQTDEQHGFASLEALKGFLQARMETHADPEGGTQAAPLCYGDGESDGELTD